MSDEQRKQYGNERSDKIIWILEFSQMNPNSSTYYRSK